MYTHYYGFSAKPFQLSPDPRFFFGSSGHKRALAYLRYGISQGEGFIVITGGIGTGKTTLVRSLFAELDPSSVVAAQLVTTQLEADDLLRMVVASFGLAHESVSKASLLKYFEDFLRSCAREGRRVLLVVDEAQNLPPRSLEELRMLSNFQISEKPLLQSFLLGQEEFRQTLGGPGMEQLRQRVIASCHLNPLSEAETREYIEHRLRCVGWSGQPHFTDGAYAAIHRSAQGVPRRINVFCDRVLLHGFLEELREFDETAIEATRSEFGQEVFSIEPGKAATGFASVAAPRPAAAPYAPDSGLDHRLERIERAVNGLLMAQTAGGAEVPDVERRLSELEPTVRALKEGFVRLTEVLERLTENDRA
ncbi:putative secretion ATPase (PEP-CTERM system associated) [Plasticicumulans lactativorans]|uniref:Putative secretion ATPase (PEP-CTERM system associated) n=1 Tax=Plasticicumulans lactativorans TaxID=1133106 RepID=A0A4V2SDF2_9GAMM|nr:XrtA/PEP-CTERM system-associated ATPase [Plasticicumulans lactativorans]TCO83177.1 putative secretion ATPase (PEP-CTERM system associated) [Plasticicumulans lactativorans]